ATATRSASGSFAMANSASTEAASAKLRSIAPGSSGFGKATVGNAASGEICSLTVAGSGYPARSTTARVVSQPTPCIAVYTQRKPSADAAAGATAADRQ